MLASTDEKQHPGVMSQAQIYALFEKIDRQPGILDLRLGRWRAWPIVKMYFVWPLMYGRGIDGAHEYRPWWKRIASRFPRYVADLLVALRQRRLIRTAPHGGSVGMIYVPRLHRFRDGRTSNFIFGDLLAGRGLAKPGLALEQLWPGPDQGTIRDAIHLQPYHSAAEALALILMANPRLRRMARDLTGYLDNAGLPYDRAARRRKILLALCLFEAKRRIFGRLARRLRLQALVATYGPGRFGEIAAARELGIPVIELQHGVFGAHCPDYAWPAEYRPFRHEIPLPDRIAVFGPSFRDLLLKSGFWRDADIVAVGAATMESSHGQTSARGRPPGPLRLVFMTQPTSRENAIPFWHDFVQSPAFKSSDFRMAIKVHPDEAREDDGYRALVAQAAGRFHLLGADYNTFDAMLESDIVVSYNSMALIEALGLGVPAISLCGGTIPEGFAGSFGLGQIAAVMPHVRSPQDLVAVLQDRAASDEKLLQWRAQAQAEGRAFFADGFTANTTALINGALARKRDPVSLAAN